VLSGIVDSSGAAVGVGSVMATVVSVAASEELHAAKRASGRTATTRDLRM
jgi:hypothetical protein